MKLPSLPTAAVALLTTAIFVVAAIAQSPQAAPAPATGNPPSRPIFPAPTNLKVLPKTLTGEQVNDIMEQWEDYLGVRCNACHAKDPNNLGPNGKPRVNYVDDSMPEKSTARLMYTMTRDINENYVSMVPTKAGAPAPVVTCGTCHRGHKDPEPFVSPGDNSAGQPPAGSAPPEPK